jgi:hypothetical protein
MFLWSRVVFLGILLSYIDVCAFSGPVSFSILHGSLLGRKAFPYGGMRGFLGSVMSLGLFGLHAALSVKSSIEKDCMDH